MKQSAQYASALSVLALGTVFASQSQAVVIVDHFLTGGSDYSTASSPSGQGPTVTGYQGNWYSGDANRYGVSATGLAPLYYGGGATGGAFTSNATVTQPPYTTRAVNRNPTDLTTITGGGTGSNPIYVSGLINFSSIVGSNNNGTVQLVASSASTAFAMQIQATGGGSGTYAVNGTGGSKTTIDGTNAPAANVNYLFVMKIAPSGATWSASSSENFSGWIFNVNSAAAPTSEPTAYTSLASAGNLITGGGVLGTGGASSSNAIGFGFSSKGAVAKYDELRVGSSWSDVVVAVPEPATFGSLAAAVGLLVMRRRRA